MFGITLKMTTMTMFLIVVIISLLLRTKAMGKETQDEYHKQHHCLQNKQPYSYQGHHQHSGYFPRSRHGYSKPHPKFLKTPCSCKKPFLCSGRAKLFPRALIAASLMGCKLATGSSKDEMSEIRQVAIDFQAVDPNQTSMVPLLCGLDWQVSQ